MKLAVAVVWLAMVFSPTWVIVKNGQYLRDAGGDTSTNLSDARTFTSLADAQAFMANVQRHNPMATWAIQQVGQ